MELSYRFSALISICLAIAASAQTYTLDLEGPALLGNDPPRRPNPTRADIFVRGPAKYINEAETPRTLLRTNPDCSVTDATEISKLVEILSHHDVKQRIVNVNRLRGLTFHVLLYQESNKTLMHFRIFEPTDFQTSWWDVYPRSDTGFGFFNEEIGPWVHARIKLSKPSPPPKVETTNNAKGNRFPAVPK